MNQATNRGGNRAPRKKKKKRSFAAVILAIVLAAVLCLAGLIAVVYASGIRYIKVNVTEDLYVKFLGKVTKTASPTRDG